LLDRIVQDRFDSSRSHVSTSMVLPHNATGISDTIKIMGLPPKLAGRI
jgi:hypothetical protein